MKYISDLNSKILCTKKFATPKMIIHWGIGGTHVICISAINKIEDEETTCQNSTNVKLGSWYTV